MNIKIEVSKASGAVAAPPSKSMAHRKLLCAALSKNGSVKNIAYSNDILATLGCIEALGAKVKRGEGKVDISSLDLSDVPENAVLDCYESGSTLRFMIPICLICGKKITLTGAKRLFERPLTVYEDICSAQGILFERNDNSVTVCGRLSSGEYIVPGDISSQFITGLLYALPLACGDSVIKVTGKFESASYIDLTLEALRCSGIEIIKKGGNVFKIKGSQSYKEGCFTVEGDYSNAAFLDAFNLLGGNVTVTGLDDNSLQGDRVYKRMFEALKNGEKHFDLSDCPDLAPVMFAMSALFGGAEFSGTARLKIKESDRAAAMAGELAKLGVKTEIFENSVKISASGIEKPSEIINGHNDHRIVMAMSVLCSAVGGEIAGAEAVEKSFPDFFERIADLGVKTNEA